jgi:hypothetical protein
VYPYIQYPIIAICSIGVFIYLRKWLRLLTSDKENPSRTVASEIAQGSVAVALVASVLVIPHMTGIIFQERNLQILVLTLPTGVGKIKAGDMIRMPTGRLAVLFGFAGDQFKVNGSELYVNGQRANIFDATIAPDCNSRGRVESGQVLAIRGLLGHVASGTALACQDIAVMQPDSLSTAHVLYAIWPLRYFGLDSRDLMMAVAQHE